MYKVVPPLLNVPLSVMLLLPEIEEFALRIKLFTRGLVVMEVVAVMSAFPIVIVPVPKGSTLASLDKFKIAVLSEIAPEK